MPTLSTQEIHGRVITPISVRVERLDSIDLLRGIIMILMAHDHVRDFLTYINFAAENFARTWPAMFFSRWITHFCAPLFFLLAGTGAFLYQARGRTRQQTSHFLWTRGLWLVFLEFTLVDFGFSFHPGLVLGGVFWGLGWAMVVLSFLIRLPIRWLAAFGVLMIFLHDLLNPIRAEQFGRFAPLWREIHQAGVIPLGPQKFTLLQYPLVPWVGVMAVGYAIGRMFQMEAQRRQRIMMRLGLAAIALFFVLRVTNVYGNPPQGFAGSLGHFQVQRTVAMTLVALFDTQKYPPSLQFLLMTIGPGLIALSFFDRYNNRIRTSLARYIVVFGRVPLFFYLLHIYIIHLLAIIVAILFHQPYKGLLFGGFFLAPPPPGYGHHLPFIYAMWIVVVVISYFPCGWFAEVKRRRRDWWLSYL